MDDIDIRVWALDRAIKEAPGGSPWEVIFGLAAKYTRYITAGTYDTPVADAAKEAEQAETDGPPTHRFIPHRLDRRTCNDCGQSYGEGNHK